MAEIITPEDLALALPDEAPERLAEVIEDALAFARIYAPCIDSVTDPKKVAALRAVLRQAIVYNIEAGSGAVTQETAGSFSRSIDTTQPRSSTFFSPSQQDALRQLCAAPGIALTGAYSVRLGVPDTLPRPRR